jgi:hypothetical protein
MGPQDKLGGNRLERVIRLDYKSKGFSLSEDICKVVSGKFSRQAGFTEPLDNLCPMLRITEGHSIILGFKKR